MPCPFCQLIMSPPTPSFSYEDKYVVAIPDLHPQAPIHQLIVPRKHIATINNLTEADNFLLGHLFQVVKKLAEKFNLTDRGYRSVINCNAEGGQTVYHLHLHFLGGRKLTWPPG